MKALASLLISMAMVACAMNTTQKLATAELISGRAGHYVAMNNPELSVAVAVAHEGIKGYQGDTYRAGLVPIIKKMLDNNDVKESAQLAKDAENLLKILGVPVPEPANVDLAWLQQFDEQSIRAVAEAFISGMNQ